MAREMRRLRPVENLTGKGKTSIYADIAAGTFPAPVKIGSSAARNAAVAWFLDEIELWQEARAAERDGRLDEFLAVRKAERGSVESWLLNLAASRRGKAA